MKPSADLRAARPSDLILDLYGTYARPLGGAFTIADLITLGEMLGVGQQAIRSSVSRMHKAGFLERVRISDAAGYGLTAYGHELLAEGDQRIFSAPSTARLADGWALVLFSIPEDERGDRYQLRTRLSARGFGSLGPRSCIGCWHAYDDAVKVVTRLGLQDNVDIFRAEYTAFGAPADLVARCWDLAEIRAPYDDFIANFSALDATLRKARSQPATEKTFVAYTNAVSSWRYMPYHDPMLPPELLPADWPAPAAAALFARLTGRLRRPAERFVSRALAGRVLASVGTTSDDRQKHST
jgi:phenylacetic acid degradation operon negative regulatory protein